MVTWSRSSFLFSHFVVNTIYFHFYVLNFLDLTNSSLHSVPLQTLIQSITVRLDILFRGINGGTATMSLPDGMMAGLESPPTSSDASQLTEDPVPVIDTSPESSLKMVKWVTPLTVLPLGKANNA